MTDEIERALSTLFRKGRIVELRALTDHSVHSGYFDNFKILVEKAESLDGLPDVAGIYITLNTINPALLSRRANRVKMNLGYKTPATGDSDVVGRQWLPVDLDPVRPSGVSSTEGEHTAALTRADQVANWLKEQGFPEPIKADSGNGAHLLYHVDLPNDEATTALVKNCLAVLDILFSDEEVMVDPANFNAARIWKLYGTKSRKGDNTPERPHRQSKLLSVPDTVDLVSIDLLRKICSVLPEKDPDTGKRVRAGCIDLRTWLTENRIEVRSERAWQGGTLYTLGECPFSSSHKDGAFVIQFPSGAVYAGCHHASCGAGRQRWSELKQIFGSVRQPKGEKICEKTRLASENIASNGNVSKGQAKSSADPRASEIVLPGARLVAEELLRSGDPPGFLLDVFQREHVGDRVVAECLLLSVASQSVENTHGLHVAISGNSGKGKSHACQTMLNLVPGQFRIKGTVSNKALYYHPLNPGTVLLFDDISLSDDLQEVLKSATANFREPIEHRTLTSDRQVKVCRIPERCVWWLAKVEAAGDDQVMNRMLCVWIDDSTAQDAAVLNHLKAMEAREALTGEDPDVSVCRALFALVKEEILHVRISYAPQIHFSASQNRRNPGMLFDLIKCHARLLYLQRERDPSGSVLATREDFDYARELFLKLTGETGAQETKQTRNEVAALSTIAKMGLEIFTIKHLQDALGLSYHQVYRLLKGYQNSKGSYHGILDKCPAVSYIDATVAEDLYGVEVKHREHYFSFDPVLYKMWSARSQIWLEDEIKGPDDRKGGGPDCIVAPGLHSGDTNGGGDTSMPGSPYAECSTVKDTSFNPSLDPLQGMHSTPDDKQSIDLNSCDRDRSVKDLEKHHGIHQSGKSTSNIDNPVFKTGSKEAQNRVSFVNRRKTSETGPLPGLLDHREFERVKVPYSKCDICHDGSAIFRCKEKDVGICERCYTKLAREWNEREGVS